MFERRSLKLPITLAVVMIVLLIVIMVGWIVLNAWGQYWVLLSVGATLLTMVLVGVVIYMILTIKAINLSRRQANFIDSVTHELKSPIASLKLYLQTLSRRQVSPQEQVDFCRYMLEDVERLDQLINHLLDAARLDKSTPAGEDEDVDLSAVIAGCITGVAVRHRVAEEQIKLDAEPCLIRGRRVDLELIFRNLIDNAVKYGGDPAQVEVTVRRKPPEHVLVRVTDNGGGIPAGQRWRIFLRFVRLGSELERNKPGTGLGLYLVRSLVDRLKGRIRVRDREGGTGTTFEVTLPTRLPEAKSQPIAKSTAS